MEIISTGTNPDLRYNCPICSTVFVATSSEYDVKTKTCSCPVCRNEIAGGVVYIRPDDSEPVEPEQPETLHILVAGELLEGDSATIADDRINETMTVSEYFVSDTDAIGSDWAVDTADGSLTITGTIATDCWIALHLTGDGTTEDEGDDA